MILLKIKFQIPFGTSQVTTAQGTSLFVYTADTVNKDNKDKTDLESRFCGRILAVGDPAGSTSANAITAAIAYKTSGGISICCKFLNYIQSSNMTWIYIFVF